MSNKISQSYWWYIPVLIVLTLGYFLGGWLVFGVHFLNSLPQLTNDTVRLVLKLFGMGMLGATIYCSRWWALDVEEAISRPEVLPHALDFFGYATTIIGGGVTGAVLYLAVRSGSSLTIATPELAGVTGEYFDGEQMARANSQAYDKEARRRLRMLSEQLTGLKESDR